MGFRVQVLGFSLGFMGFGALIIDGLILGFGDSRAILTGRCFKENKGI